MDPGGTDATVAVKVTGWPPVDGLGDEVTVVAEALAWTFWTSFAFPALNMPSPL
jgi:hypothetical protein